MTDYQKSSCQKKEKSTHLIKNSNFPTNRFHHDHSYLTQQYFQYFPKLKTSQSITCPKPTTLPPSPPPPKKSTHFLIVSAPKKQLSPSPSSPRSARIYITSLGSLLQHQTTDLPKTERVSTLDNHRLSPSFLPIHGISVTSVNRSKQLYP